MLRQRSNALAILIGVLCAPLVQSDDTEIYFTDPPTDQGIANVLFILDHSGSMNRTPDGEVATEGASRYNIMRDVFDSVLADLPPNISAGLMHYGGHNTPAKANGIQYPVRILSEEQRQGINGALDIQPGGYTPLVQSLYEGALYFRGADAYYGNSIEPVPQAHEESLTNGYVATETPSPSVTLQCIEGNECDALGVQVSDCRDVPAQAAYDVTGPGGECIGGLDEAGLCLEFEQVTTTVPAQEAYRVCDYEGERPATIVPDYTYESPIVGECQANYMVLLSDGEPDDGLPGSDADIRNRVATMTRGGCSGEGDGVCGPELTDYLARTDQSDLPDEQVVKTFAIGFANTGDGNEYLQSVANLGDEDTQAFYTAESEAELLRAFTEIIDNIAGQTSSLLPPTISLDSAGGTGENVYLPLFRPSFLPRWAGNLKRHTLDEDNQLPETPDDVWAPGEEGESVRDGGAASLLGTDRNVLIDNQTRTMLEPLSLATVSPDDLELSEALEGDYEAIIQFARGIASDGELSRQAMGDILHSRPLLVSQDGREVVYVGSNEGYLHAFDAASGEELFAFMPRELLPNLQILFDNDPVQRHPYGMDGQLTVWKTGEGKVMLFAGMRRGGRSYYALDVTNPEAPKIAWRITGGETSGFDLLGQTWSKPVLTKIEAKRGTEPLDVLIFGGGYDPLHDDETCNMDGVELSQCPRDQLERLEAHARRADDVGRKIFIVDASSGQLLWSAGADHQSDSQVPSMLNAIAATPAVIDLDNNGVADRIYAAGLGGRIFRIDLPDSDNRLMSEAVDFDQPQAYLFANLNGGDVRGNRRFFSEPDVSLVSAGLKKYLAISLGSGYRAHPLDKDTVEDRLYVVRDYDVYSEREADARVIQDEDLDNVNRQAAESPAYGWYYALEQASGEKALARAQTINNTVFFTTFIPNEPPPGLICDPVSHQGAIYTMDLRTADVAPHFIQGEEQPSLELRKYLINTSDIPPEVSLLVAPQASGQLAIDTFVGVNLEATSTVNGGDLVLQGISKIFWEEER